MKLVKTIQGLLSVLLPTRDIPPQTGDTQPLTSESLLQKSVITQDRIKNFHPHYGSYWIELDFDKTVQLSQGECFSLNEASPELKDIMIGLGWDDPLPHTDLETYAFICGPDGLIRSETDVVFYNNIIALEGGVEHLLDNTTSVGGDANEAYKVNLEKIPPDVAKIVFTANINSKETINQISNIFIRIVDISNKSVIAQYDIFGNYTHERSIIFAELSRKEKGWTMVCSGSAFDGVHDPGGGELLRLHGLSLHGK
jgi:tellurium resistance protein TerD